MGGADREYRRSHAVLGDATKVRANANRRGAMSYGRMIKEEGTMRVTPLVTSPLGDRVMTASRYRLG